MRNKYCSKCAYRDPLSSACEHTVLVLVFGKISCMLLRAHRKSSVEYIFNNYKLTLYASHKVRKITL